MRNRLLILLFCSLITVSSLANAASAKDDWGMWLSNTYQTDFGGSNYLAFLELAPRTKHDNGEFSQIIVRPLLGYKLTRKLQLWLGYT